MDDDIIRMAREAQQERLSLDGRSPSTALSGHWFSMEVADLARFAALVRADERKRIKAGPVEEQSIVEKFNAAFDRLSFKGGDAVLIERRDSRLYMNDSEIGPGTLEIREDGVTYRSAALVDVRKPQQAEPVAEARYDGTLRWLEPHGVGLHRIQGPLFTAPPQRKPLTEEEIDAMWRDAASEEGFTTAQFVRNFARAVERAHGIGDNT